MTTVRIAHTEPWPGKRMGGRGFRISSFLVVLADDSGSRALPVWLNGPEGHGLLRGMDDHPHPEPAEVITAGLLRAAGVTVTGVDIDELDTALTTGPRHGRDPAQATARIGFTAAGTAEPQQMTVRIGYALAMAVATGAPVRVADQLMNRLAVPAQGDLVGQFTRDVPLPKRRRGLSRLFRRRPPYRGQGPQAMPSHRCRAPQSVPTSAAGGEARGVEGVDEGGGFALLRPIAGLMVRVAG
jgi:bifunctional DNase/RNase